MSESDPGCVKTCTSRECAELFSLFSSFDGDCQSGSFLIQRNRDRLSTRKPDVGVFTQSGPKPDIGSHTSIEPMRFVTLDPCLQIFQSIWHGPVIFQSLCICRQAVDGPPAVRLPHARPDHRLSAMKEGLFYTHDQCELR